MAGDPIWQATLHISEIGMREGLLTYFHTPVQPNSCLEMVNEYKMLFGVIVLIFFHAWRH